jgi:tetratricopeptide (TPR) repeat protein
MTRVAIAALMLMASAVTASAQPMESARALERWVAAVLKHQPGHSDASARYAAALTYSDRLQLNPAMQRFLRRLRGENIPARDASQQLIVSLFESVRSEPGLAAFVRRAAILHTDAAVFADRFPEPRDDAPEMTGLGRRADAPPPLLSHAHHMLHTDGRVTGESPANWNWPFARSLLDLLLGGRVTDTVPADRGFVGDWYHALAAYLFAVGNHADLRGHLLHGAESLPDDARISFHRACLAETLGLSYNQALRDDAGYSAARRRIDVDLPSQENTNEEAERFFRRALELEPSMPEARVRLARLLERRGRYDEAMAELTRAQASSPPGAVAYYAHLVAGRVALSRGRFDESVDHYQAATKLYPDAQSALLGASQAAVMASDVPRALSFVRGLGERSRTYTADPWRYYRDGAGRDVNELMNALWARAVK